MATYYCRHGETFNGDGLGSAAATVGGEINTAFNDAKACQDGTQAGIGDGDTVIFKTTAVDNVSNVGITLIADHTFVGGTSGNIIYKFDDGTVWPGQAGRFDLISNGISFTLNVAPKAHVLGEDYRLRIRSFLSNAIEVGLQNDSYVDGIHTSAEYDPPTGSTYCRVFLYITYNYNANHGRIKQDAVRFTDNTASGSYLIWRGINTVSFEYLEFNMVGTDPLHGANPLIDGYGQRGFLRIKRLVVTGMPDDIQLTENFANEDTLIIDSLRHDNKNWVLHTAPKAANEFTYPLISITDIKVDELKDGNYIGNNDFWRQQHHVLTSHDSLGNYPYLDAFLPDGVTNYSIKAELAAGKEGTCKEIHSIKNYYDQSAAALTLEIEMLVYNLLTGLTNNEFFMTVSYEDTTGVIRTESSRNGNALTTSTAGWSQNSYARTDFDKYKVGLLTQYSVAQNTTIFATLYFNAVIPDTSTYCFMNPKLSVS